MKKIILLVFAFLCVLVGNDIEPKYRYKDNYSFDERVFAFKKDGLVSCLYNKTFSNGWSISGGYDAGYYIRIYQVIFGISESYPALEELTDYVKKAKKEIVFGSLTHIIPCLKIYESPEYNAEVKRIVKKYCKECK